jgi:hypothetical protein
MVSKNFRRFSGTILLSGIGIAVVVISSLVFLRLGGSHQSVTSGPRLILGPNPASPGSVVTISGFDFPATKAVKIYFQDPSHGVVNTVTNAGGFFNAGMTLPNHINDASRVYAVSGPISSSILLQVMKPSLTALNTPSSQDGIALINGEGFLANKPVTLTLSNGASSVSKGMVTADRLGQITYNLPLTDLSSDTQDTLVASDPARNTAFIRFNAAPRIYVRPLIGSRGSRVTVIGMRFSGNEKVTINFQGQPVATTQARGGRFVTSFTVPLNAVGGPNTITAIGASGDKAPPTTFKVISNLLVVPHSGFPGQSIAAFGGSFTPNGSVVIKLMDTQPHSSSVGFTMGSTTARSNGTIQTFLTVPSNAPRGRYSIVFIDTASGKSTSASFFVA